MYAVDLTPLFNELLKKNEGRPTAKVAFSAAQTEGFLKEAYRINGHIATLAQQLRNVRPAYLSTAPRRRGLRRGGTHDAAVTAAAPTALTDAQREEIDGNAKRLLRDLHASIRGLAEAQTLHADTQRALVRKKFGGGSLGRLGLGGKSAAQAAAEAALAQAEAHRESILWHLRQQLQACGQAQQTMMEARVARMMAAATLPAAFTTASASAALAETEPVAAAAEAGLTEEQRQMFERDNQDMLQHYETALDKVRAAEQSLVEIAELQSVLVGNLELQAAHVDQLTTDSLNTAENVARGNQELKRALERPSTARYTFYAATGLCLFVVVWDFFV